MSRPSACLIIQFDNVYWWKYTGGWKYLQVLNVAATSNLCVSKCFGNCHAQVVRSKLVLLGSSVCALTLMFGQDLYFASLIHRKKSMAMHCLRTDVNVFKLAAKLFCMDSQEWPYWIRELPFPVSHSSQWSLSSALGKFVTFHNHRTSRSLFW